MSRARAASEEPTTDTGKRAGDTFVDELFSAKRRRLSDYGGLENFTLQQNRKVSQESDNGGVRFSVHEPPARVTPGDAGLDDLVPLIERPSPCGTEGASPDPSVNQQRSASNSLATPITTTNCQNSARDNESTTEDSCDAEVNPERYDYPKDSTSKCPIPPLRVDVEMESAQDSEDMWTSVTSSDSSGDEGVEIRCTGKLENAFFQTYPPVPLPEQTLSALVEEEFGIFKAHIEDAFSSFKREVQSVLAGEDKSSLAIMKDMLTEKDGIISLLKAEIDQLRNELEKCRELLHQHGKETEEWADRMMGLICRLPGFESV